MLTFRAMRDPMRPVIYDNLDDIWRKVDRWLTAPERKRKHTLGLGIDRSDSLLYEGLTGHARQLIPVFSDPDRNRKGCRLVLLTKSTNVHFLEDLATKDAPVSVTFSVNPEPIADLWEGKYPDTLARISPPISDRLRAAREAQRMGFDVRLRLDPILTPPGWEEMYAALLSEVADLKSRPSRITLGTYREKSAQLDTWREKWGLPPMEWEPPTMHREGTHRHVDMAARSAMYAAIRDHVQARLPGSATSLCKETTQVRKNTGMCGACCNCL